MRGMELPVPPPIFQSKKSLAKRTTHVFLLLISTAVGYALTFLIFNYQGKIASLGAVGEETRRGTGRAENDRGRERASTGHSSKNTIHTLTTTNGSPYQNYQMRIAYASYLRILDMPGGEHHVAFTRVLHRTDRDVDVLASEIPTFRADPLQPVCDDWCEYPVSDRANAVAQYWKYAQKNDLLHADWYYMIESDYVFVKPLLSLTEGSTPVTLDSSKAYGYFFYYISPPMQVEAMRKLYPEGEPSDVQSSGPAPLLMSLENWLKVTPGWEEMAAMIESDEFLKNRLGWVREMYGFCVAMARAGIEIVLDAPGAGNVIGGDQSSVPIQFIREMPIHDSLEDAHAFHYTLATIIKSVEGEEDVWGYDKRWHVEEDKVLRVPALDPLPKFPGEGKWKFIEGSPVTKAKYDTLEEMVKAMNVAIADLKVLEGPKSKSV
jgi:hypothetical protein